MFNRNFYPTPTDIICQMIEGLDLRDKVVLEPSAGKGNIVDVLHDSGAKQILTCEINPDLERIVKTKSTFLQRNFLELDGTTVSHIDCIVMNPPFDKGVDHVIKAWDIAPSGCDIVAIINTSTLENRHTKERKRLHFILMENNAEIIPLGKCFDTAERTTNVRVTMLKFKKTGEKKSNKWEGYFEAENSDLERGEGIVSYNAIRDAVSRYTKAIDLYEDVLSNAVKMSNLINEFQSTRIPTDRNQNYDLSFTCTVDNVPQSKDEFAKSLRKKAWQWIFNKMNMRKYMTKKLMGEINQFVEQQFHVPFTMKNIYEVLEIVVGTHGDRMNKALIEVFENLTKHTHENRYNVEGWKTNSCYMINKKFILNWVTEKGYDGQISVKYKSNAEKVDDLQKALCHLTGKNYEDFEDLYSFVSRKVLSNKGREEELSKLYGDKYDKAVASKLHKVNISKEKYVQNQVASHKEYRKMEFGTWYDWGFFEIKGFKKGTMHFKFKDVKVWDRVNKAVCEILGEVLPEKV